MCRHPSNTIHFPYAYTVLLSLSTGHRCPHCNNNHSLASLNMDIQRMGKYGDGGKEGCCKSYDDRSVIVFERMRRKTNGHGLLPTPPFYEYGSIN